MPTPRELLAAAKSADHRGLARTTPPPSSAAPAFLDVREGDEHDQGAIPGAVHVPRGQLEFNVEGRARRTRPRASSSTARQASARRSRRGRCTELGYPDVVSMAGGFNRWKDEGLDFEVPRTLARRPARALPPPPAAARGRRAGPAAGCSTRRSSCSARAGLGSPAALYLAAAGVGTIGIIDMDVVDASNLQRQVLHNLDRIGERKVDSAKKTLTALNPDVTRRDLRRAARRGQRAVDHRGLRPHRRRHGQLPDALPRQRRVGAHGHPRRARLDLPLRGPGHGLRPDARSVLPLPAARAAARRARTELRGGRRARRPPGHHRLDPGARGDQGAARPRRPADRPAADLRRARRVVPHVHGCARTPSAQRAASTPATLVLADYDELCMPHPRA